MRVDAAAIVSTTASGSSGANRYSRIAPTTRGSSALSGDFTTTVYKPSCAASASRIRRSAGITPTPQTAQSSAFPSLISRSRYTAWWARWKPPTPTCTMPVRSARRSYVGRRTSGGRSGRVAMDSAVT